MRRVALTTAALVVPLGLTASPAAGQLSDSPAASAYQTYVACSHKASAPKSHSCGKNQDKGAFFKSRDAHVKYDICVKYPGRPAPICARDQDAPKGAKQVNTITSTLVGKHKVKWYVEGEKVGSFKFRVKAN